MICANYLTHQVAFNTSLLSIGCIPHSKNLEDIGLEVIRAGPLHKIAELDFGGPLHSLVLTLDVFFGQ